VFGKAAEAAAELRKGDRIYCEGTLKLDSWTGRDGAERHGLSVASFKCERTHQIGRKRPKREHDGNHDDSRRTPTSRRSTSRSRFENSSRPQHCGAPRGAQIGRARGTRVDPAAQAPVADQLFRKVECVSDYHLGNI
jgi:single-stranded DNA-binding protein